MPVPVDPGAYSTGQTATASIFNNRFAPLYNALNPASVGLDELNLVAALLDKLGVSAGATLRRGQASVPAAQATASAAFTDLGTDGPSVTLTVPANGHAIAFMAADISTSGGGGGAGGTIEAFVAGVDSGQGVGMTGAGPVTVSKGVLLPFVGAGSTVFKLRYRADGGATATFANRKIAVVTFSIA
jgi:hypothetical protein